MSSPLIAIKCYSILVTFVSSSTISAWHGEEKEFSLCLSEFLAVILIKDMLAIEQTNVIPCTYGTCTYGTYDTYVLCTYGRYPRKLSNTEMAQASTLYRQKIWLGGSYARLPRKIQ